MDTASANSMVTDSAAASTAWGGGQRVNNGAINVSPEGKEITPIAAILRKKGARIGLVSTATITHATPAGFAASVPKRGDEDNIAPQYLDRVDVLLGGGSGISAKRTGLTNATSQAISRRRATASSDNRDGLLAAREEKLLGTFTRGHLPFSIDRDQNPEMAAAVPTLTEMAQPRSAVFSPATSRFSCRSKAPASTTPPTSTTSAALLGDQLAFDDALAAVMVLIGKRDDILLVVTSDHGNSNPGLNGMGNGYAESTQRFAQITNMKASHERLFAEWGNNQGRHHRTSHRTGRSPPRLHSEAGTKPPP